MGMNLSYLSSGYSFLLSNKRNFNEDFFDSDGSYGSDNERNYKDYNYYIIDNRMKDDLANNIKNFVKTAFERYNSTKERSESLQNKLGENYSNNFWKIFIYQNGYCKVSFSDELYICGKILNNYIIIFGYYKKFNKCKDSNKNNPRSKSLSSSQIKNRERSRSRSRSEK